MKTTRIGKSARITAGLGCGLLILGLCLPLWSKDGVTVNGWEGNYLSVGRWLLLAVTLFVGVGVAVARLRKARWWVLSGGVALLEAGLVLWQGYHLGAIGMGAWVLAGGGMLIVAGGMLLWRREMMDAHNQ